MPDFGVLTTLLQAVQARGSRSTALYPMQWLVGLSFVGFCGGIYLNAPDWALALLGIALGTSVVVFILSHGYLMLTNVDALRSERFTLDKIALEKGLVGDSLVGVISRTKAGEEPLLIEGSSTSDRGAG